MFGMRKFGIGIPDFKLYRYYLFERKIPLTLIIWRNFDFENWKHHLRSSKEFLFQPYSPFRGDFTHRFSINIENINNRHQKLSLSFEKYPISKQN